LCEGTDDPADELLQSIKHKNRNGYLLADDTIKPDVVVLRVHLKFGTEELQSAFLSVETSWQQHFVATRGEDLNMTIVLSISWH
jgi:hypothetical protein